MNSVHRNISFTKQLESMTPYILLMSSLRNHQQISLFLLATGASKLFYQRVT